MIDKKKILFVVNPISGIKGKEAAIQLLEKALAKNISYKIVYTERTGHATELTKNAAEEGYHAVIAVGGDGTVNEVAKALIHSEVALGVIPFGSGNGFARHLGIPLQVKAAIQCINKFNIATIDTASLNKEPFIATAGMGFDAHIASQFANYGKRGFLSYSQIALNEFLTYKSKKYSLKVDGIKIKKHAFLICFANVGQYGNNAWIAPTAEASDGKLKVCILEPFPAHLAPDILLKLFNKTLHKSKYYEVIEAERITIKRPNIYQIDGEAREKLNRRMKIKVVPHSLKVIC
ncbi:MAG: YegS/Rv2252/BmrU family lipid kinase [Flavobacteriales bacterium]|nr:YegS/Rv2252/BmrU family lipid kinase [Flavobacteriales bacterium]